MKTQSAAMDFFAHQDEARKNSRRFVLLYTLAVIVICVGVGIIFAAIGWYMTKGSSDERLTMALIDAFAAAGVSAAVILGGSLYRINELRGGGASVAHALGGVFIDPSTRDPDERRVLNVVEEMAIASGVPVPPVYMMTKESGINAFAAGYSPGDAVIGVTRGCVQGLTREELQGVMAHEFSHILNGDMRLNIRMLGFLNGILLLSITGRLLLQLTPRTGRSKEGGWIIIALFLIAIYLIVVGSIGSLFARIIQAAVSRQREFLADASAVQFTRNPEGIGNALRRIGGSSAHAKVRHPRAAEAGHMFFGEAVALSATLASHPPLKERIRRVMPDWDGTFLEPITRREQGGSKPGDDARERLGQVFEKIGGGDDGLGAIGDVGSLLPLLALSGTMTQQHIDHAQGLIGSIPAPLREAARDPYGGRAVVYALLLDRRNTEIRTAQLRQLETNGDPAIAQLVRSLATEAVSLKRELRLPLLDMTLGSLSQLSESQHAVFRSNADALIRMDKTIDLFEWVTINSLKRHLDQRFGLARPVPVQYYNLKRLGHEVSVLLSMLAHTGSKDEYAAGEAVLLGESAVRGIGVRLLPPEEADMRALDTALKTLNQCSAQLKKQLLRGAALVVGADRVVTTNEAELLRAIADSLDVPTPPLLPGQKLS